MKKNLLIMAALFVVSSLALAKGGSDIGSGSNCETITLVEDTGNKLSLAVIEASTGFMEANAQDGYAVEITQAYLVSNEIKNQDLFTGQIVAKDVCEQYATTDSGATSDSCVKIADVKNATVIFKYSKSTESGVEYGQKIATGVTIDSTKVAPVGGSKKCSMIK